MGGFKNGWFQFELSHNKKILFTPGELSVCGSQRHNKFLISIPINSFQPGAGKELASGFYSQGIDESSRITWHAEFRLNPEPDSAWWKISIQNISDQPINIQKIFLINELDFGKPNFRIAGAGDSKNLRFYSNGWQSWSFAGSYGPEDRMVRTRLGFLQKPMIINPDTPIFEEKGKFSSDFFSVLADLTVNAGLVIGFLSQKQQFGSITADNRDHPGISMWANCDDVRLDPGQSLSTDWAVIYPIDGLDEDPLSAYLIDVAKEHQIVGLPIPPVGWCSWYHYYQKISESIILENLHSIKQKQEILPLDLVQIDDGYQAQVGDWLEFNQSFPDGVGSVARKIKKAGLTPGVWMAPFILHPSSRIAKEHPDWLLRKTNGSPVRTGFVWNTLGVALDLTNPGALDYVRKVINTAVKDWGFPYLKLDFLYAAALKGHYQNATKTRAQVLRKGLETVWEAAGNQTVLVGCGVPLGSALGLTEVMRIGADVSGDWTPSFNGVSFPFKNERSMPSARNSLQNILSRAFMHNRWWVNDPDCLLIRPDTNLTLDEVQSLTTAIAMTGGSVLISDDMARLPEDRIRLAAALFPPINQRPQILDWLDGGMPRKLRLDLKGSVGEWSLLAFFNWSDKQSDFSIESGDFGLKQSDYLVRSYWGQTAWQVNVGNSLYHQKIPAHGVALLAVRNLDRSGAIYLGSDLHISQGLEIADWNLTSASLRFTVALEKRMGGFVDLFLSRNPGKVIINSRLAKIEKIDKDIYRIHLSGNNQSNIAVHF